MSKNLSLFSAPAFELRGIGGWLLLFCIGCLLDFLASLGYATDSHKVLEITGWSLLALLNLACGILLWMKSQNGLRLLYPVFAVTAIQALITFAAGIKSIVQGHSALALTCLVNGVVGALITYAWFRYFKESVRVYNTYGRNL